VPNVKQIFFPCIRCVFFYRPLLIFFSLVFCFKQLMLSFKI